MFCAAPAAFIRAAAYPVDLVVPGWPDLATDQVEARRDQWLQWLRTAWEMPTFADAVAEAAPDLAAQIRRTLDGHALKPRRLRRLVESTVRYLLRWTTRATPYGHFAGVAPIRLGERAAVAWGRLHRAVPRPDEHAVAEHVAAAEQDLGVLRTVEVMTCPLGYARGGVWVLPCARANGDRVWDVHIALTEPVRTAVEAAALPIPFPELAAKVAAGGRIEKAERLLAALVGQGVLLSQVRPPMTVTDPAAHLARHTKPPESRGGGVDLRVDCSVTLPGAVVTAAQEAAEVLCAIAPRLPGWDDYHHAFIDRWGPGAAVPLREVVQVLGYPAGYRGSARRAAAGFTARDALLVELAQRSALNDCAEVVLDDALVNQLRGDDDRPPIPHTELRFTLAADQSRDLDRGAFCLTVLGGSRHAGATAGRLLHLLTPREQEHIRGVYARLPTALPGADIVQLSGPPLHTRLATLARTPRMLPVLPVGDFEADPAVTLAELAVTCDGTRLWLVRADTGQPVEPLLLNSVLLPTLHQPMTRFLTEIWTAWNAPCTRFDWGHAARLPFLPRIRRGKVVVHPARWSIDAAQLPGHTAPWPQWLEAWHRYRDRYHIPHQVLISQGADDMRLRLDLDQSAHLAVLRSHLDRHGGAHLTETSGPAGWIGDRPAEIVLTLTTHQPHTPAPARAPGRASLRVPPARPATRVQHLPGLSARWLETRVYGLSQDILTGVLARLADLGPEGGWWYIRHHTPSPHLRLRIPLQGGDLAACAQALARWATTLAGEGLISDYALVPYRPETRHGHGPALAAAETVFATDSRAVLAALDRLSKDREAATATGMIEIAQAWTGGDGARWLVEHVPHRSGPRLDPDQLARVHTPFDDGPDSGADAGPVAAAAADRAAALTAYRAAAERNGLHTDQVLADLLHLHHARTIGIDPGSERHCLRLARAVALTHLHRHGRGES